MAIEREYPLLVLPPGTVLPSIKRKPRGGGAQNPKKARQIERLGPAFQELQRALESRSAAISETASGFSPEQVLVFETNGPARIFLDVIASTPELEWLVEYAVEAMRRRFKSFLVHQSRIVEGTA